MICLAPTLYMKFSTQADTYKLISEGKDVVGRARTGCGKTLAFVLPVVEQFIRTSKPGAREYGRSPQCVVLAPTRELAKQVSVVHEKMSI